MATSFTTILKLALPATGELAGTWGDVVNQNITSMIEEAIAGLAVINTWAGASHTLTTANGTTSESRAAVLDLSGSPGGAATVICPDETKIYVVRNGVTGGFTATIKTSAGTGITIPNGRTAFVFCDGTNVELAADFMDVAEITTLTSTTGNITTVNATTVDTTNIEVTNIKAKDGTSAGSIADSTGVVTLASSVLTTTDINGGTIDGTIVGGSTPAAGTFSGLTATTADINGGTIDGTIVGATTASTGAFTTLSSSSTTTLNGTTIPASKTLVDTDSAQTLTNKTLTSPTITGTGTAAFGNLSYTGTLTGSTGVINIGSGQVYKDASGNVMIGGTTPSEKLQVVDSGDVSIKATKSAVASISMEAATTNCNIRYDGSTNLRFLGGSSGTVERAQFDSSGSFLVGTTNANPSGNNVQGISLAGGFGYASFSRSGDRAVDINRSTDDGDLIRFRREGNQIGGIGSRLGAVLYIVLDPRSGGSGFTGSIGSIIPTDGAGDRVDNNIDLGDASFRFDDIYATNGTIQTSDENEKQDIESLTASEKRVAVAAKSLLKKFRWKSAVEKKGDEARIHFGIIAQDLQAAFEAEGLDAGRYAMFINSTNINEETGEERSRMGVRYSELLAFIIAAI